MREALIREEETVKGFAPKPHEDVVELDTGIGPRLSPKMPVRPYIVRRCDPRERYSVGDGVGSDPQDVIECRRRSVPFEGADLLCTPSELLHLLLRTFGCVFFLMRRGKVASRVSDGVDAEYL